MQRRLKLLFRRDEAAKARAGKLPDAPCGQGLFKRAPERLDKAGAGHARRARKMRREERGRRKDQPPGGFQNYLCHRRLKGRAGASWSSVMETLCAPAAQGAT